MMCALCQPKWFMRAFTSAAMMPVLYADKFSGMVLLPMPLLSKVQHLQAPRFLYHDLVIYQDWAFSMDPRPLHFVLQINTFQGNEQ